MATEDGVPSSTWEKWNESGDQSEYAVHDKIIWDDNHEISVKFLSPLGRGVSGSVFLIQIVESIKHPQINNLLFSLKIYKTQNFAIAQGQNEMLILPLCQRSFNTTRIATFPNYLTSLQINGHLALIMELGGPTLVTGLSLRKFRGLSLHAVKQILTKILIALAEMEKKGLVHGDIKPENILFSFRNYGPMESFSEYSSNLAQFSHSLVTDELDYNIVDVMLIDWSSSSVGYNQVATYMQSRYYRAPEVIMRSTYGPGIDVWSTACVAVELFTGKPLFPGTDELDMLRLIQQRLGIFPQSVIKKMGEDSIAKTTDSWKMDPTSYSPGNFEAYIREESRREDTEVLLFINIMRLMLQLNPDARTTASSALIHPFITGNMQIKHGRQRRESSEPGTVYSVNPVTRRKSIRGPAPKSLF